MAHIFRLRPIKIAGAFLAGQLAVVAMAQSAVSEEKPAGAEAELNAAQETLLRSQLEEHYKCELGEILFLRKFELGGDTKLEGRVRCTDQREVDFTQNNPHLKFELRLCQPTVC
jgi:hypothetical protein